MCVQSGRRHEKTGRSRQSVGSILFDEWYGPVLELFRYVVREKSIFEATVVPVGFQE